MSLKYIKSSYGFFNSLTESIKTAKEYFFKIEKEIKFRGYKENLISSIRTGESSISDESPEEQIRKVESGQMDRELEKEMLENPAFSIEVDPNLNNLFEKIKQNKAFGPNIIALPVTKMYVRYMDEPETGARLMDLVDTLDDNRLKEFFKSRNIDLGKLLNEFAEKREEGNRPVYEMFTDYLTILKSEIEANWLIKEFRTDAAMGGFNQVEAFRSLREGDKIREDIIRYARLFDENKKIPSVQAAIKTVRDKLVSKASMQDVADWLLGLIESALDTSDNAQNFLRNYIKIGNMADLVYNNGTAFVLVVHHELALATLFPSADWCILPRGWGGGQSMWSSYVGPNKNAIQFAIMDYSKSSANNMRCWAFSYNVNTKRVTHAHAKDDSNILANFPTGSLKEIFTEKPSISGSRHGTPAPYPNSDTFTMPDSDLFDLDSNIINLYEKTVEYDSAFKLRDSSGSTISDFSKSSLFKPGGLMLNFIIQAAFKSKARSRGVAYESFSSKNKSSLDMILAYLAADVYSINYKKNKKEGKPTLSDTFILPFIKAVEGQTIPLAGSGYELATYIVAALKVSEKFKTINSEESTDTDMESSSRLECQEIVLILKGLGRFMKLLLTTSANSKSLSDRLFYLYQLEEAVDAFVVYCKSLGENSIPNNIAIDSLSAIVKEEVSSIKEGESMTNFQNLINSIIKYIDTIANK